MIRWLTLSLAALLLQAGQQPRFRSGVDLVEVDVSVMRGGVPVTGLTTANFVVTDNGVTQEVTSVRVDRLPLSVLMVLDISGSVAGEKLGHLIDAGQKLVDSLRDADRAALVTFSQEVRLAVPPTGDKRVLTELIANMQPGGATSMYDALHVALLLPKPDRSRPVVILFTDGQDNSSWIQTPSIVTEVRRLGVVIHAIELRQSAPSVLGGSSTGLVHAIPTPPRTFLKPLSEASGGRVWSASSSSDLRTLFTRALEEMRARYLLTFTPPGVPQPGWHQLKVTLRNARGEVTARPAYFVEGLGR